MENRFQGDMSFSAGAAAVAKKNTPKKQVTVMRSSKNKSKNKKAVRRMKRTAGTGMNFIPGGSED